MMMLDTIPNTIRPYLPTLPMRELEELALLVAAELQVRHAAAPAPLTAPTAAEREQLELWKLGAEPCAPKSSAPTALGPR